MNMVYLKSEWTDLHQNTSIVFPIVDLGGVGQIWVSQGKFWVCWEVFEISDFWGYPCFGPPSAMKSYNKQIFTNYESNFDETLIVLQKQT